MYKSKYISKSNLLYFILFYEYSVIMDNLTKLMNYLVLFIISIDCYSSSKVDNAQISKSIDPVKTYDPPKLSENINAAQINQNDAADTMETIDKSILNESKKGHILFFHQLGTKSHIFVQKSLVEGLLMRGHQVTTVLYVKTDIVHKNYTEILIKDR